MKALFRCEKNWQKINVQRFSANFLFSKNGKCRSITYSGDFATLPFIFMLHFMLHPVLILIIKCYSTACSHNNVSPGLHNLILTIPLDSCIKFRIHNIEVLRIQMFLCDS